jgi:hypothetical protein
METVTGVNYENLAKPSEEESTQIKEGTISQLFKSSES